MYVLPETLIHEKKVFFINKKINNLSISMTMLIYLTRKTLCDVVFFSHNLI